MGRSSSGVRLTLVLISAAANWSRYSRLSLAALLEVMAARVHTLLLSESARPELGPGEVLELPIPTDPYRLRIVIPGTSPVLDLGVPLKCNYPSNDAHFDRENFQEYDLQSELSGNCEIDILVSQPGAFTVKIGDDIEWNFVVKCGFEIGGQQVTANGLAVQTVLSKLVPGDNVRAPEWRKFLEDVAYKGYNMIHFVPLQPRGESGSPFSLLDQLSWDKTTFPKQEQDIEYLVQQLTELGILALSDIVLNHTASDSPWLKEHPEAGYSKETAPHLTCAIDLDTELLKVKGFSIKTSADLAQIDSIVKNAADMIKLWEFYVVDVQALAATVTEHPFQGTPPSDLPATLEDLGSRLVAEAGRNFDVLGPRFGRNIDSTALAEYVAGSDFTATELLNQVNAQLYDEYNADVQAAISSIKDRQRYLRLDDHGPKIGSEVSSDTPIVESYFNRQHGPALACNGWVWGGNPLVDHAGPQSKAYIRRELIVWGDCTKLRYGRSPQDSPYLWKRMGDYAKLLAKHFSGLRLDNAHSTPLHVGEYILDQARKVRPNLYVVAELFSGSQEMDKLYVERLGIASLLREAIMPGDPKDLSTTVQVNGGLAIGSFVEPLVVGSKTHAWLMEVTHDNETMTEKRTVEDTLPTAGLVAMCQVASGSTFGSDECYPHALNVVSEERRYVLGGGITRAKRVLNELHKEMAFKHMFESYTDYKGQYITVHRINPESGEGIFLVARTKFWDAGDQGLEPICLEASSASWHAGWSLVRTGSEGVEESKSKIVPVATELRDLEAIKPDFSGTSSTIHIDASKFPQGSVAIWRTSRTFDADSIENLVRTGAEKAVADLNLLDLNVLLYHAEGEERASSDWRRGTYSIPDYGNLVYAGLQGWESLLRNIVLTQDLGHPLCNNLRNGLWAFEYLTDRAPTEGTKRWLGERLEATRKVPTFLRPRYFAATILGLYDAATTRAITLMKLNPEKISTFYKRLVLTSVQMVSELPNCSLWPNRQTPTMAAGLPHFSEGIMRCWGRDCFLSVSGLLIKLNRLDEAREHILGFGATLKYGLIPNLLDSGRNPRYNARDATWFFAQCVQDYCKATKSYDILHDEVQRRFPLDDSYTDEPTMTYSTVGELVFEILSRHAAGIRFREHNAGSQIDMHMKSNGFNQRIWTDWETGIVFGGSQDNCGTWMDKMGESTMAGSEGVPGTPRDGAAIEITGLLKSCLQWVIEVRSNGGYPFKDAVSNEKGEKVTIEHWNNLIQNSFEKCYWVPETPDAADSKDYDVDWNLVNRRGIYKDVYRSGKPYEDYQFRGQFAIAVNVAPELFDIKKISKTLDLADTVLRGPVGFATLDPSDWNYRPYYINGVENTDFATSKGRNYHQGPEWIWVEGEFLQAYVRTLARRGQSREEVTKVLRQRIQGHVDWIRESPWAGLTELTQKNGEFCPDSSPTQAWSSAQLIDAIAAISAA